MADIIIVLAIGGEYAGMDIVYRTSYCTMYCISGEWAIKVVVQMRTKEYLVGGGQH